MSKQISSGLKTIFLIHFIIATLFGLIYMLIPNLYGQIVNWPIKETAIYRLVGAALIGYGASSWFALKIRTGIKLNSLSSPRLCGPSLVPW